jgi:tungstate transport system substrate-binding protein
VRGKALLFGAACLLAAVSAAAQEQVLRVAVSSGLTGTGLLEAIASDAKAEAGITVDWEAAGPEGAVSLAETCGADALLIDDPEVEKRFMEQGKGAIRLRVMFSDYVLLGPAGDPAGASGKSLAQALAAIARRGLPFVGNQGDPETLAVETRLWAEAGRCLPGAEHWYLRCGSGALDALRLAAERQAYVIAGRGPYLRYWTGEDRVGSLAVLIDADAGVRDQYDAIAVNPDLCPRGRFELTVRFLQWIVSPAEQGRIGRFTYRGFPLFFPNAGTETCPTCR